MSIVLESLTEDLVSMTEVGEQRISVQGQRISKQQHEVTT
jgi:hypothetical protein